MKKLITLFLFLFASTLYSQTYKFEYYYGPKFSENLKTTVIISENINSISTSTKINSGINYNEELKIIKKGATVERTTTYYCVNPKNINLEFHINQNAAWIIWNDNIVKIYTNSRILEKEGKK